MFCLPSEDRTNKTDKIFMRQPLTVYFLKRIDYYIEIIFRHIKTYFLKWGNPFCIFCLAFLLFYFRIEQSIYWDTFTSRDIFRASGWLKGQFYWPGPEMSGGNNLPGPFFYFLLFPSLIFGNSIYSQSILWFIAWLALTYTLAAFFLGKVISHKESFVVFLILFISSMGNGLFRPIIFGWNAGFSILFHILSISFLYYWRQTGKSFYLYLLGLTIALGIQVHFLVSIHIVTVLFFVFFRKQKLMPVFLFLFLIFFPVLIYIIMNYLNIFQVSPMYQGKGYLELLIEQFFSEEWFKNIKVVLPPVYIALIALLMFLTLWKRWKTKKWPVTGETVDLFIMVGIPVVTVMLIAGSHWYLYFIPVLFMLLLSKWCDDLMPDNVGKRLNFLLIYGVLFVSVLLLSNNMEISQIFSHFMNDYIFLIFIPIPILLLINTVFLKQHLGKLALLAAIIIFMAQIKGMIHFRRHHFSVPESFSRTWPTYQILSPIMQRIFLETNWSSRTAMKRIYFVGIHPDISLFAYYSIAGEEIKRRRSLGRSEGRSEIHSNLSEISGKRVTGYIIIQHLKEFTDYSHEDWKQYLSHSSLLSDVLRQEIRTGQLLIKHPQLYNQYWLIPYQVEEKSIFPEGFHNIGQPYYWEEPEWIKNCHSIKQFKNKNEFFYCMTSQNHLSKAGVHLKLSGNSLDVYFFGSLIGGTSFASHTDGHALWSDIQVNLLCDQSKFHGMLPNVGLNHTLQKKDATEMAKRFSTPLRFRIPVSGSSGCNRDKSKRVQLTFNHSYIEPYFKSRPVKKIKIVWDLH